MKKCPYCAEEIQEESVKCRFCGEWLHKKDDENIITEEAVPEYRNKCKHCGKLMADKSIRCGSCNGLQNFEDTKICPECDTENPRSNNRCIGCGYPFNMNAKFTTRESVARGPIPRKSPSEKFRDASSDGSSVRCPKCFSNQISANKKGFGLGKGIAGAIAIGPAGLLAGGLGKNKINITCLKCGHKWIAGS